MSKIYCKYHRQEPAWWACPACKLNLCPRCVKAPSRGIDERHCPVCKGVLQSVGMGNVIPPFWECIPKFFAYPARLENFLFIAFLSLASFVALVPVVGIFIYGLILLALLNYAYVVLEHTAMGNLDPPIFRDKSSRSLPGKQNVIFVLMAIGVGICGAVFGKAGGFAAYLAANFAVPASVMALAVSGSLAFAANPLNLARLIGGIGWPYALLFFFLLILSGGAGMSVGFLSPWLPLPALLAAGTFALGYFLFAMFHMMGYAVYQYHEALGLQGVKAYAPVAATASEPIDELMAEMSILVGEGRAEEAKSRLKAHLKSSGTPEHRRFYHKLLMLGEDTQELCRHGKEYIAMSLAQSKGKLAADILGDCLSKNPSFRLDHPDHSYRVAEAAFLKGGRARDDALSLLERYAERFPRHPLIPAASLLEAKILCECKHDDLRAKDILNRALREFPEHDLAAELREYLQMIERLESVAPFSLRN